MASSNDLNVLVFNEIKNYIETNLRDNTAFSIKHLSDDFEHNKGFYMDIVFNDLNIKDKNLRDKVMKKTWDKVSGLWCKMKDSMFEEFHNNQDKITKRERKQVERTLYSMLALYVVRKLDEKISRLLSDELAEEEEEEEVFTKVSHKKRRGGRK